MIEVFTRSLGCTSEKTTHHNSTGTKSESLHDVSNIADTTIRDDRNTELAGKLSDVVDSCCLGTSNSHDLLGYANGARTHSNADAVGSSGDETGSLLSRDYVAGDDLELGECLFDPLNHLDLENRVSLRRIEDNDVEAGLDEKLKAFPIRRTRTDGSRSVQLLGIGLFRGQRVSLVLQQVGAGKERLEPATGVDKRQLALLGVAEDRVSLLERDTFGGGDQVGGHDIRQESGRRAELNIAICDDTDEFTAE